MAKQIQYRFTIAEDDPQFLYLLHRKLLQAFPHSQFSTFSKAEDALQHILENGADILISGHGGGILNGIEMIRELRARGQDLTIIMVSNVPQDEREARDAGANVFVNKNMALNAVLVDEIKKFLPVL